MEALAIWLENIVEREVGEVLGRELGAGQRWEGRGRKNSKNRVSDTLYIQECADIGDRIFSIRTHFTAQAGATFALPVKVPAGNVNPEGRLFFPEEPLPACSLLLPVLVF